MEQQIYFQYLSKFLNTLIKFSVYTEKKIVLFE